jgi:hypothetical protein
MRAVGLSFGMALSVASGILFGYASVGARHAWVSVAVLALLAGLLLTLSAVLTPRRTEWTPPAAEGCRAAAPPLGEMLLGVHLLSREDLERALARQRATPRRLGQILVDMNLITHAQLAEVLEEQLSRRSAGLYGSEPAAVGSGKGARPSHGGASDAWR